MTEQPTLDGMPEPQAPAPPVLGNQPCDACQRDVHRKYPFGCTCTCHVDQVWVSVEVTQRTTFKVDLVAYVKSRAEYLDENTYLEDVLEEEVNEWVEPFDSLPREGGFLSNIMVDDPDFDFRITPEQITRVRHLAPEVFEVDDTPPY